MKIRNPGGAWTLIVNVSAKLQGPFVDWPSNIQDGIYTAIEAYSKKNGLSNLEMVGAICRGDEDGWYVKVDLAEIVPLGDPRWDS